MAKPESGTAPDDGAAATKPGRGVPRAARQRPAVNPASVAPDQAAMSILFCNVSAHPPIAEIRLSGELAEDTVADLGAELAALIRTGHEHLIIDGSGLSHVSPACVGLLNRASSDLRGLGGELILTGISGSDADALRSAGLHAAIQLGVDADLWLTSANDASHPPGASNCQPAEAPPTKHHPSKGGTQ